MKKKLFQLDPLTALRFKKFKSMKRGYYSFLIFIFLLVFSLCGEIFINSKPLLLVYKGQVHVPMLEGIHRGSEFGYDYDYEVNYRILAPKLKEEGSGFVILPIVPYNPLEQDFIPGKNPPYAPDFSKAHYLGTDGIGRDILARLIFGFRIAISFSLLIVFTTMFIGTIVGVLMGYWGGIFDIIMQRIVEIWEEVPLLYVVMIVVQIFKPDFFMFVLIFSLFGWASRTYTPRAMTYRERERDYILAARSMGASTWRIATVHIIPNILVVIVTILPFAISGGISTLTVFDYLGFGLPAPTPSWGELLSQGVATYKKAPWILASILSATVFVLTIITFIGEALRDAFDPKKYTQYK